MAAFVAALFAGLLAAPAATGLKHRHSNSSSGSRQTTTSCDLFVGTWVYDDSRPPPYQSSGCPLIDPEFNCQLYGRPDAEFLRYRWKPAGCDIPSFDGIDFLSRMRGKTVLFVGDSLGRNQWESLVCLLHSSVPASPTQMAVADPLYTFKFLEYAVTAAFYRAPYLVDIDTVDGKRVLRLDDISGNAQHWAAADVLVFNTGHWWTHKGDLNGWDYMEDGGSTVPDMDRLSALRRALATWAAWVDGNVDGERTRVFFQSISPTHYKFQDSGAGEQRAGGGSKSCFGETAPERNYTAAVEAAAGGEYIGQPEAVRMAIKGMRTAVYLLDVTAMSAMRKDGHPSVYSGALTPAQRADPTGRAADCSHWCLPGVPDAWNQLFYAALHFS